MHTGSQQKMAVGLFDSRDKAESAISALYADGFESRQIGIAARQVGEWRDFPESASSMVVTENTEEQVVAGAATGAAAGAGIGGLWALGIAAGMLPAVGPIVAGGLLASLLASAAAGAAAGGVVGGLIGLGVPEEEAHYYDTQLSAGRTLVTVNAGPRYDEAMQILFDHGAMQVSPEERQQAKSQAARTI